MKTITPKNETPPRRRDRRSPVLTAFTFPLGPRPTGRHFLQKYSSRIRLRRGRRAPELSGRAETAAAAAFAAADRPVRLFSRADDSAVPAKSRAFADDFAETERDAGRSDPCGGGGTGASSCSVRSSRALKKFETGLFFVGCSRKVGGYIAIGRRRMAHINCDCDCAVHNFSTDFRRSIYFIPDANTSRKQKKRNYQRSVGG